MKVTVFGGPKDGEVLTLHDKYRPGDYVSFPIVDDMVAVFTGDELYPTEAITWKVYTRPIEHAYLVLADAVRDKRGHVVIPPLIVGWYVIAWTDAHKGLMEE